MSLANDVVINSVGLTPNPVNASSTYLAQVGAEVDVHTWGDWSSTSWASVAGITWG